MNPPCIIGLTGGIACGKTTVAGILADLGAVVVDADTVARAVVEPGTLGLEQLTKQFGDAIIRKDGSLDRAAVAQAVFSDPIARDRLNAILHPLIAAESKRRIEALVQQGHRFIVYDAALLVEKGLHRQMDALIVVAIPEPIQRARLAARDGLDDEAITNRLRAQLPLADKIEVADYVIDNSKSLEETRRQTISTWQKITSS